MRNGILIIVITCLQLIGCKPKKNIKAQEINAAVKETPAPEKTSGKISHQFRSTGCNAVIVAEIKGETDSLILIPRDPLPEELNANGLEVYFNYHTLKMPQPPGCSKGIPAEITNLEKK